MAAGALAGGLARALGSWQGKLGTGFRGGKGWSFGPDKKTMELKRTLIVKEDNQD